MSTPKRRRKDPSISPKMRWARRVKWISIVLACCLLAATFFLLVKYKPPQTFSTEAPAASGTSSMVQTQNAANGQSVVGIKGQP